MRSLIASSQDCLTHSLGRGHKIYQSHRANKGLSTPSDQPVVTPSGAQELVETTIFKVGQSIAGEATPVPGRIFSFTNLPINSKVSDKVRAKIWAHEYIDLS